MNDGPCDDLYTRFARDSTNPALIQEMAEWEWVSNSLQADELRWARCRMEFFPDPANPQQGVEGFAFVTDRNLFLCPRDATKVLPLSSLGNARISREYVGYLDVTVWVDGVLGSLLMRPLDRAQFASFLPTLHYAALS